MQCEQGELIDESIAPLWDYLFFVSFPLRILARKTRGALRRMTDQDRLQLSEIQIEIVSLYSQAEPKLKSQSKPKQSATGRGGAGQGVHAFDSRFVWPKQPLLPALTASLPRLLLLFAVAAAAAAVGAAAAAAVGALSVRFQNISRALALV